MPFKIRLSSILVTLAIPLLARLTNAELFVPQGEVIDEYNNNPFKIDAGNGSLEDFLDDRARVLKSKSESSSSSSKSAKPKPAPQPLAVVSAATAPSPDSEKSSKKGNNKGKGKGKGGKGKGGKGKSTKTSKKGGGDNGSTTGTAGVTLVDETGSAFTGTSTVQATMVDSGTTTRVTASGGRATFSDLEPGTYVFDAVGPNGESGLTTNVEISGGQQASVQITLSSIGEPTNFDNLDFSDGLNGWDVPEGSFLIANDPNAGPSRFRHRALEADNDLVIPTGAEPLVSRTASTTFNTGENPLSVTLRFRFQTDGVAYIGTGYDDYYLVQILSLSNGFVSQFNSVTSLGAVSFDSDGSTSWFELTLGLGGVASDVVQVKATIANGGHAYFESMLIIDQVFLAVAAPTTPAPTPAPTIAPVSSPTSAPVVTPTSAPVIGPTSAPVVGPTSAPVVGPTEAPVTGGTGIPSEMPSGIPSDTPSLTPTIL